MPRSQKISVGPLPEQNDDFTRYEQTDILWGRIGLIFGAVFAVAFSMIYLMSPNNSPEVVSVHEQRRAFESVAPELAEKNSIEDEQPSDELASNVNTSALQIEATASSGVGNGKEVASQSELAALAPTGESARDTAVASYVEIAPTELEAPESASSIKDDNPSSSGIRAASVSRRVAQAPTSVITSLHPGILNARLASDVDARRQPIDELGYEVSMDEAGLIKVILHTEMQGIAGVTLFHEWFQGDERRARVRIPVNKANQSSFSSKYIDTHMLGDWSIEVRDEQGELYAMASFTVLP